MKFAFFILLVFLGSASAVAADEADWKTVKADHFIVYYVNDEGFAKEVARKSDVYYAQIASDLGYARYSNFWLWDNRVKIFIFPSEKDFQEVTRNPEWSGGTASYSKKEIYSFVGPANFIDGVLPHEITHLIFRDFVGTTGEIPLWMDEGVAQWEEPAKRELAKKYTRDLVGANKAFSVEELVLIDARKLRDREKVRQFYMQSVSLVDFLISTYGNESFTVFCRQLRDRKTFNDALKAAYKDSIPNIEDLDLQWKKYAETN